MAHEASLPTQIISPADVYRLVDELAQLDDTMLQLGLRSGGTEVKLPKTSRLLDQLVGHNKLNLLKEADRKALRQFIEAINREAPRLHFSFSADPSAAFLEKLIAWLRQEIHPYVLVTVGLQPGIGAGCRVRSTNKYFDFSLGQTFAEKRELLLQRLRQATAEPAK